MLEVAKVTKDDYVFDLGSGDGRIPILAASRYGARGLGVDINPKLVALARALADLAEVADRVEFRQQDLFETSVREATVVALYLFAWANVKLRPRLVNELRPGSRIIAHDFPIGHDWRPDVRRNFEGSTIYLWHVPAQVAGRWEVKGTSKPMSIQFTQRFQTIRGVATIDGRTVRVQNARLRGDVIEFSVALEPRKSTKVRGRIAGDKMELDAGGGAARWRAARTTPAVPIDQPPKQEKR
jgi:SAM-dependent methyltransferase